MRDLLIIVPTRARPASAKRLIDAVAATCAAWTDLIFAVDHDDDSYDGLHLPDHVRLITGPRATCPEWTNLIAAEECGSYGALASLGDDHVPRTQGWDGLLLAEVEKMGAGIAYGDDTLQHANLPTAPVMSSSIVAALGWMFLPGLRHYYADNVWKDLGQAAGCLAYVPEVVVEHLHYVGGKAQKDAVYTDAEACWQADQAAYGTWRHGGGVASDAGKVAALRAGPALV